MKSSHLEEIAYFEKQRAEALLREDIHGPNSGYARACVELGIEPEPEVVGDYACEIRKNEEPRLQETSVKLSKNHAKYGKLIRATRDAGIDVDRIMADTEKKRDNLRTIMGYSNLFGKGGRVKNLMSRDTRINILDATDSRIGLAYKSCYNQARKEHPGL